MPRTLTAVRRRRTQTHHGLHGLAGRAAAELERLAPAVPRRRPRSRADRMLEHMRTLSR